jgi:ATP-dependent DNA helicase RecG
MESDRIERTISISNTDKFGEAICAFANDLANNKTVGYLLIGVDDSGNPSGAKIDDKLLLNLSAIRTDGNILPQPVMNVKKYSFNGKDIAVVEVTPSDLPPVSYRGRIYIRVGPRKGVANRQEEIILTEKRISNARTFDARPFIGTSLTDMDVEVFKNKYLIHAVNKDILDENGRDIIQQLASLRFFDLKNNYPTNAGILCFSNTPTNYLSGAYIQYVKFRGVDTMNIQADKEFKGNIVDVLEEIDKFVKNNIISSKPVRTDGFTEVKVINYPILALREFIMNAVMHRDYESNTPIRIHEFDDRIIIQNPGGLYGEAQNNFPNFSAYRNPVIAEVLKNLGYVNKFNVGIKNAMQKLAENGNPAPDFKLTLFSAFQVEVYSKI